MKREERSDELKRHHRGSINRPRTPNIPNAISPPRSSQLPPSQRRRSTLGFVNQMMFTKRVGAAWKNAVKSKQKGEDLKKTIQDLTVKKLEIAKEIRRLQESERDATLSLQQLEIKDLEEKNKEIRMKLAEEVGKGSQIEVSAKSEATT